MANQPPTDVEAQRMELQEAIVTFRQQMMLLVQIVGFLIGADSLLLGYGFAQSQGAILLVASAIPVILMAVASQVIKAALPIAYVAITLEQELGLRKAPLATIFAIRSVLNVELNKVDPSDPAIWGPAFSSTASRFLRSKAAYIVYAITALQLVLFFMATFVGHFHFF